MDAMHNEKMDKIVVLARGLGTRMRRTDEGAKVEDRQAAVADAGIKALIPLDPRFNRPFLDYVLSVAAQAGYRHACLVIGPEQEAIREYYGRKGLGKRLDFSFACQREPKGTADAVAAAEEFAASDPFAVINSDDYYPLEALQGLREQSGCATALFEKDAMLAGSNVSADRIARFAVAKIDANGRLERIIEKPDEATLAALPRPLWVSMNCWRFGPSIFEASRAIKPSPRGEYELPDAVQYAINVLGEPFAAVTVRAPVLDLTSRGDIASVAKLLAGIKVEL
jgi:dTDP-glucose pyrophosphorylase